MTSPAADLPDWLTAVGGTAQKLFQGFVAGVGSEIPVGQFESVHVILGNIDGVSVLSVTYAFVDSQSGFTVDRGILTADLTLGTAGDGQPSWSLPVVADKLVLTNGTAGAPVAVVIGRPASSARKMLSDYFPARAFQANIPASSPVNTRVQLLGQDGNSPVPLSRDCSNYNGNMACIFGAGAAISGQIQYGYRDDTGARVFRGIANNPIAASQTLAIGHPFAFVTWWFITSAVSPASATLVFVNLIPAETSV